MISRPTRFRRRVVRYQDRDSESMEPVLVDSHLFRFQTRLLAERLLTLLQSSAFFVD
jgi:hypothetical protein